METLQQALGVVLVLALLGATLWWLRQKGMAQFAFKGSNGRQRSLRVVERLALTPQHSLHLVQVAGRTILVAASPHGCSVLDPLNERERHSLETQ